MTTTSAFVTIHTDRAPKTQHTENVLPESNDQLDHTEAGLLLYTHRSLNRSFVTDCRDGQILYEHSIAVSGMNGVLKKVKQMTNNVQYDMEYFPITARFS